MASLKSTAYPQSSARFKFLVRPVTTVNVSNKNLSNMFEDKIFAAFKDVKFISPISGLLILPTIIDRTIAAPPPDHIGYEKRDNSVSVGINIDFLLWERSSQRERLTLLADNIHCSLKRIKSKYLADADRKRLRQIVDKVHAQLAAQLVN